MRQIIAYHYIRHSLQHFIEDKRITRIILPALLRDEMLVVGIRRNEYTDAVWKVLSMSKLDFNARVKENDDREDLFLIYFQKTW